jgi:hypothetical protein
VVNATGEVKLERRLLDVWGSNIGGTEGRSWSRERLRGLAPNFGKWGWRRQCMMVEFGDNDGTIGTHEEGMGESSYVSKGKILRRKLWALAQGNLRDFYFWVSQ